MGFATVGATGTEWSRNRRRNDQCREWQCRKRRRRRPIMEVTQSYARPSTTTLRNEGLGFEMAAEASRPNVALQAVIRHSLSYARTMLALYEVVSSNAKFERKDTSAYQAWVQERYLEELE